MNWWSQLRVYVIKYCLVLQTELVLLLEDVLY